jgi:hypothetical protein
MATIQIKCADCNKPLGMINSGFCSKCSAKRWKDHLTPQPKEECCIGCLEWKDNIVGTACGNSNCPCHKPQQECKCPCHKGDVMCKCQCGRNDFKPPKQEGNTAQMVNEDGSPLKKVEQEEWEDKPKTMTELFILSQEALNLPKEVKRKIEKEVNKFVRETIQTREAQIREEYKNIDYKIMIEREALKRDILEWAEKRKNWAGKDNGYNLAIKLFQDFIKKL